MEDNRTAQHTGENNADQWRGIRMTTRQDVKIRYYNHAHETKTIHDIGTRFKSGLKAKAKEKYRQEKVRRNLVHESPCDEQCATSLVRGEFAACERSVKTSG
uniref:Transposase n=1 Tax=Ascaris lumbricoides TaxID=6252 RepID=A0A0M3I2B3_ASCLU